MVWQRSGFTSAFAPGEHNKLERLNLDQLFFEGRVSALHAEKNVTAIRLKMYLTNLHGSSEAVPKH
jgi:hypothetical protein